MPIPIETKSRAAKAINCSTDVARLYVEQERHTRLPAFRNQRRYQAGIVLAANLPALWK